MILMVGLSGLIKFMKILNRFGEVVVVMIMGI